MKPTTQVNGIVIKFDESDLITFEKVFSVQGRK